MSEQNWERLLALCHLGTSSADVQSLISIARRPRKAPDGQGRYRWLVKYSVLGREIPGWTRGEEAIALALVARQLPPAAVIVEIGSFLGSSTVLLAGARKTAGSGKVHCVDPFDASGDDFSVPVYRGIVDSLQAPLRQSFEENIRRADLSAWVQVHQGMAQAVGEGWTEPVDMLFFDGDQSPEGVRSAYEAWGAHLRVGGIIAVHNSADGIYAKTHDGQRRLVVEAILPPRYADLTCIGSTTFARKMGK
jgi:hypothetical protein